MSYAAAPYERLSPDERLLSDSAIVDGIVSLRRLLPMGRARFDKRLGNAMAEAARRGSGFYLDGYAARRALGAELVIRVDPAILARRLDHRCKLGGGVYNMRGRFLGAGDWRPLLRVNERSSTHREVVEIVAARFDYRATPSYHKALQRASGANPVKRNFVALSSPARVEAYFRQTAELCRSVHTHGVVRRGEFGWRLASLGGSSVRLPWIELGEVDIGVAIGPAGEIHRFASGKHRTAAAQALGVKSMPVEVRMVHAEWLARQMQDTGLGPCAALLRGVEALKATHG